VVSCRFAFIVCRLSFIVSGDPYYIEVIASEAKQSAIINPTSSVDGADLTSSSSRDKHLVLNWLYLRSVSISAPFNLFWHGLQIRAIFVP
jgi:hypothetical protein